MKIKLNIIPAILLMLFAVNIDLHASQRGEPVRSFIEKGIYIPGDIITPQNMRLLPIPYGNTDYTFYQSIQKISNVVIGKFKQGEREIVLLQDNDNDGKVDIAAHWAIDSNRLEREGDPDGFCSAENFKKLKEGVFNGKAESVSLGGKIYITSPNKEALSEIERLAKSPHNVTKYKQGLRIRKVDPDEESREIMIFSYSTNLDDNTVDLAFEVKYYMIGKTRISPIIPMCVYCLKSEDPFAIETVKKLRELTGKYLPK